MSAPCECGCGLPAPVASRTRRDQGVKQGQQLRFRQGHNRRLTAAVAVNWSLEEVMRRVEVAQSGCWLWRGSLARGGYGKVQVDSKSWAAHRFVYTLLRAEIPEGLHLDHLCHSSAKDCPEGSACLHRRCVNPDHLEPVTNAENLARASARRRTCHKGLHQLTEDNLIREASGKRQCKACRDIAQSKRGKAA